MFIKINTQNSKVSLINTNHTVYFYLSASGRIAYIQMIDSTSIDISLDEYDRLSKILDTK